MKKILLTLLLVAGGFVAQAQDTITTKYFTQAGVDYVVVYAESDNEQCTEASSQIVYGYNSSTGILTINDAPVATPFTGAAKNYYDSVFAAASALQLVPVNSNGIPNAGEILTGITYN